MPKPILDYRDDDSPLWPARCRGYLEGRQASDCLANVELARLRAENERLRAALRKCEWGGFRMHEPSGTAMSVCPVCRNNATDFHGKHSFGCEIAAALKAEP